jgi:hypothetical protein
MNRGIQQVVLATKYIIEASWTETLVTDQYEYEMPTNFVKDRTVEWRKDPTNDDENFKLEYITWDEYMRTYSRDKTQTGDPAFYTFWRRSGTLTAIQPTSIYICPTPNDAVTNTNQITENLRVYGYKIPDDFDSTGTDNIVEMPGPYVEAAVAFAAHLMFTDDGDGPMSDRLLGRYRRMIEDIQSMEAQRTRSERSKVWPRESVWTPQARFRKRPIFPWERGY